MPRLSQFKIKILRIASILACFTLAFSQRVESQEPQSLSPVTQWRSPEEQRTIEVFQRTNEAVVFISTTTLQIDPFEIFPEVKEKQGIGSGVIIDAKRGLVITNLHVIEKAQQIEIFLASGGTAKAKLLGIDPDTDIALLQLRDISEPLTEIPFADSSKLSVGQRVLAIGNPFGLNKTLTAGIISSLDRTVKSPSNKTMRSLIQTDAAINPGNSGGPLIDMDGKLIGINTQILSNSGDSAGIGFAVPINQIRRILPELVSTGRVRRPKIGWLLVDTNQGPMVRRIFQGSPAEEAGVEPIERPVGDSVIRQLMINPRAADVIYAINGVRVFTVDDVDAEVQKTDGKTAIRFTFRRGSAQGKERVVSIMPVLQ